jgi:ABC-type transport system involved in cytochrome bd biosynthesis fused ATPase/permease subunit
MILVMNEGQLVERGVHSELLNVRGIYSQLHEVQMTQRKSRRAELPGGKLAAAEPL